MKKLLAVLMCLFMVAAVFSACSSKQQDGGSKSDEAATSEAVSDSAEAGTTALALDEAVIKDADAINLVSSYSAEELSLSDEDMKNCSFMLAGSGVEIDGANYVKVIAAIKNEKKDGDKVSYTFDIKGEYYLSYDGKQLLKKDMESGEYTEMTLKEVPTEAATQAETEETTE